MQEKIRRFQQNEAYYFSEQERRQIIEEYLNSGRSKCYIWEKYTGRLEEKGNLLKWMRRLGYSDVARPVNRFIEDEFLIMDNGQSIKPLSLEELQKENQRLKKALEEAEQKAFAYSKLVDVAEKMFNIPIRKKPNTKP